MRYFLLFFNLIAYAYAQNEYLKYDRVWVLSGGNIEMHFDSTGYTMVTKPISIGMDYGGTNICNRQGQLQLITDGFVILNGNRDTVLYPINTADYNYPNNVQYNMGQPVAKANVFLEDPAGSNRYYLLHSEGDFDAASATYDAYMPHLYYTHIDMSNGTGTVLQSQKVLLDGTAAKKFVYGTITACRHANGRDWWVLVFRRFSKNYCRFLVSPAGIQNLGWTTDTGASDMNFLGGSSYMFSPDGLHTAMFSDSTVLYLWDFDRCTGTLSNLRSWDLKVDSVSKGYMAFSPNSRFLYLTFSSGVYLYQLDLQAPDPFASRKVVAVYDGYTINGLRGDFYAMQLAPDNRIYAASASGEAFLHVINHPDSLGIACDVQQHSIMTYTAVLGLPNHPAYRLGVLKGSGCDTIGTGVELPVRSNQRVRVYPNPAQDEVTFTTPSPSYPYGQEGSVGNPLLGVPKDFGKEVGEVVLHDLLGREVLRKAPRADTAQSGVSSVTLDISPLPNGIYLWHCAGQSGKLVITR